MVCEVQYARSTRIFYYIWLDVAVCKPACFSGHSDPQSSVQQKICHIHHGVCTNVNKAERAQTSAAMTDDSAF